MHKVVFTWGLAVDSLFETARRTCLRASTGSVYMHVARLTSSGKTRLVRSRTGVFPTSFAQDFFTDLYLLFGTLSPVSTAPIITNVKINLKGNY